MPIKQEIVFLLFLAIPPPYTREKRFHDVANRVQVITFQRLDSVNVRCGNHFSKWRTGDKFIGAKAEFSIFYSSSFEFSSVVGS